MSNVIEFLERMGQDAKLRHFSSDELERALSEARVTPEISAALLTSNRPLLETLLGAPPQICCAIHAPEDDEEEPDGEDEPEYSPRDDSEDEVIAGTSLSELLNDV